MGGREDINKVFDMLDEDQLFWVTCHMDFSFLQWRRAHAVAESVADRNGRSDRDADCGAVVAADARADARADGAADGRADGDTDDLAGTDPDAHVAPVRRAIAGPDAGAERGVVARACSVD